MVDGDGWRTWREAMADALYGERGFYRSPGAPARHFRTAAHTGAAWCAAITALARRVDKALGTPETFTLVDVGAGGGELLAAVAQVAPERWTLVGVDAAPRPLSLPARVAWQPQPPDAVTGLVLAVEVLDVVPVDVVERAVDGVRLVEVAASGHERLGQPVSPGDVAWLDKWWLPAEVGDRAEPGTPRDEAWAALTATVHRGLAVAVDYAADPRRHLSGTLTGYRDGRQVAPVPDGTMDVTAHVLFDSLRGPGDLVTTQRDAMGRLGVTPVDAAYDGDPATYLAELARAGEIAELRDPSGLGGFSWLLHPVEMALLHL